MGFNKFIFCPFKQNKIASTGPRFPSRELCLVRDSGRFSVSSASSCAATGVSCATRFLAVMLVLAFPEAGCQWIREFETSLSTVSESSLNKVKYWVLRAFDEKNFFLYVFLLAIFYRRIRKSKYVPNERKKKQLYYCMWRNY